MSHGEYIPLQTVEHFISKSEYVEICCCLSNLKNDALVAIICPKIAETENLYKKHYFNDNFNTLPSFESIIKDKIIQNTIIIDIKNQICNNVNLNN